MKKIPSKITKETIERYKKLQKEIADIEKHFYNFLNELNIFIEIRLRDSGNESEINFEDWYDCEFLNSFWETNAETLMIDDKLEFKITNNNLTARVIEDNWEDGCIFKLPLKYIYDIELLKRDIQKYTSKKLKEKS